MILDQGQFKTISPIIERFKCSPKLYFCYKRQINVSEFQTLKLCRYKKFCIKSGENKKNIFSKKIVWSDDK